MMFFLLIKIKATILLIIRAFRRALCCFRTRSQQDASDDDGDYLTHVGVVPNKIDQVKQEDWNHQWEHHDASRKPQTVEEHIQLYREKLVQPGVPKKEEEEVLNNIFEELTPQVIKQKRVLIGNDGLSNSSEAVARLNGVSRLNVSNDYAGGDLGEWIEETSTGWDEQHIDPMDFLREQKKIMRESKRMNTVGKKLKH